MQNLLEALLGGGRADGQAAERGAGADILGDLLGSILGGGTQARPAEASGGDPMADIIGTLIGGQSGDARGNGQLIDMISTIMGGGRQTAPGADAGNPMAEMLAEKFGISPQMAAAAVAFFTMWMVNRQRPAAGSGGSYRPGGATPSAEDDIDLDDLLDVMDDERALGRRLSHTGMPDELARRTGIDQRTATDSLAEIVKMIGSERRTPQPAAPAQTDLKGLLDNW